MHITSEMVRLGRAKERKVFTTLYFLINVRRFLEINKNKVLYGRNHKKLPQSFPGRSFCVHDL